MTTTCKPWCLFPIAFSVITQTQRDIITACLNNCTNNLYSFHCDEMIMQLPDKQYSYTQIRTDDEGEAVSGRNASVSQLWCFKEAWMKFPRMEKPSVFSHWEKCHLFLILNLISTDFLCVSEPSESLLLSTQDFRHPPVFRLESHAVHRTLNGGNRDGTAREIETAPRGKSSAGLNVRRGNTVFMKEVNHVLVVLVAHTLTLFQ